MFPSWPPEPSSRHGALTDVNYLEMAKNFFPCIQGGLEAIATAAPVFSLHNHPGLVQPHCPLLGAK